MLSCVVIPFFCAVSVIESLLFSSDCCKSVTLSAFGGAGVQGSNLDYLGSYEATGQKYEGAPVYSKSDDTYLFRHSDGTWRAGSEIGFSSAYMSVDTAQCPASNSQWQYATIDGWRSGDITVECN